MHDNTETKTTKAYIDNTTCLMIAEYLFVLLPLIVVAIIYASDGELNAFLQTPEWSFAAAILFGLTIIKFFAGIVCYAKPCNWQISIFYAALTIVFGLVPSLIVLSVLLTTSQYSLGLVVFQIFMFAVGTFAFFYLGKFGQSLLHLAETDRGSNEH